MPMWPMTENRNPSDSMSCPTNEGDTSQPKFMRLLDDVAQGHPQRTAGEVFSIMAADINDELDPEDEANLNHRHMYLSEIQSPAGEVGTKLM